MDANGSADGTLIASERTGRGRSLLLVAERPVTTHAGRRPTGGRAFAEAFSVFAIDRRGYGECGDIDSCSLEREFEDVTAVLSAIDDPVTRPDHSHGASFVHEGVPLTGALLTRIVYEPTSPWGIVSSAVVAEGVLAEMVALRDDDAEERALVLNYRADIGLASEELNALGGAPNWQNRVAAARAMSREERASAEFAVSGEPLSVLWLS